MLFIFSSPKVDGRCGFDFSYSSRGFAHYLVQLIPLQTDSLIDKEHIYFLVREMGYNWEHQG